MRYTPSCHINMMNRWPSAKKTSATPENRMNSHAYFSKYGTPPRSPGRARMVQAGGRSCSSPAPVPRGPPRCCGVHATPPAPRRPTRRRAHRNRSAMCIPNTPSAGINTASQTPATTHNISR